MNLLINRRILLIDDLPSIHADFRKILTSEALPCGMDDMEAALFGSATPSNSADFTLDSAFQGREGVDKVTQSLQSHQPYAMAFVDMRMPPGLDGVETIEHIWAVDPRVQVVICTAFSDYSWDEVLSRLDVRDRLLILKKPFDLIEVRQLANALTAKWSTTKQAAMQMDALEHAVQQRTRELTSEIEVRHQTQVELQNANQNLQESEERYRLLVELSPDAILIERAGRIVFANSTARNLYRENQVDELLSHSIASLVAPEPVTNLENANGKPRRHGADTHLMTEERALCLDGNEIEVMVSRLAFHYQGEPAIQMVVRDVSEHKRMEDHWQHQASHDTLTKLPNRNLLMDRLHQAIGHAQRNETRLAVCFMDLDRFKWINDNLGHAAGDELLVTVAQRIKTCLRETDTVARLGGDEFVLLLCSHGPAYEIELAIQRVVASVAQPLLLAGREVSVSCSAGCSNYPEDGHDADALLKFADAAMYRAKEMGRNNLQIYNAELHSHLDERQKLEKDLRHAIEKEQLVLHYQPQVDLRSGAIVGIEVLLRWLHPEFGSIPPSRIIPLAESTGLIESIGTWTIQQACAQNKAWQRTGLAPMCVSVNISAKQVAHPGLVQCIAECLAASQLEPCYLELEMTERTAMQDLEKTIALMGNFKRIGVRLAIDNFGVAQSNLRSLARLPIDKLKLDGSFVKDIVSNPDSLAIANTIVTMAHQLGLTTIAEMAETEGQVMLLAQGSCDHAQGYYFSRALPPAELLQLLLAGNMAVPGRRARNPHTRTLLVLDDDPSMTQAVKRGLKFDGYRVLLANRAQEAFELLACNDIGVVLCDQRLQETTGVEMLVKIRRLYPHTMRLLFSGYKDFDAMGDAINRGAVYKFLSKPVDSLELREVLVDAFKVYEKNAGATP